MMTRNEAEAVARVLASLEELDGPSPLSKGDSGFTLGEVPLLYFGEVAGKFIPEDTWWSYEPAQVK